MRFISERKINIRERNNSTYFLLKFEKRKTVFHHDVFVPVKEQKIGLYYCSKHLPPFLFIF